MKSRALLLVAHGSRRADSNREVLFLAKSLAALLPDYKLVRAAFLELNQPDIVTGLTQCVDAGAKEIQVLPYFLSAGRHVSEDVPTEVARFCACFPEIEVQLLAHIGAHSELINIMAETARSGGAVN